MSSERLIKTCLTTVGSVAAAVLVDFLINGVMFPGSSPYTPISTLLIATFVSAPSWYFVIGQRIALQQTRDGLARSLAERDAAATANAAKSAFLAKMSHELRTPMNAIIGYAEILKEDADNQADETRAKDLSRILNASHHLLELINEVLDLSKIEAGALILHPEELPVAEVIEETLSLVRSGAEKNGDELVADIGADLGCATLDRMRLRQCLVNLLSNACKFTKDGKVIFTVRRTHEQSGDFLRFEVRDTGIGISPAQMSALFQPFVKGDSSITRKFGGTGLGLAITKSLIDMMGGTIAVESEVGQGSTFVITLPIASSSTQGEDGDPPWLTQARSGKPAIITIDDSGQARDLIARTLEPIGFEVIAARTLTEGKAIASSVNAALLILDLHLPDGNGLDFLRALKAAPQTRDIPVVVLSMDDRRLASLQAGACEHLVKPAPRETLTKTALRFARGRSAFPQPHELALSVLRGAT